MKILKIFVMSLNVLVLLSACEIFNSKRKPPNLNKQSRSFVQDVKLKYDRLKEQKQVANLEQQEAKLERQNAKQHLTRVWKS